MARINQLLELISSLPTVDYEKEAPLTNDQIKMMIEVEELGYEQALQNALLYGTGNVRYDGYNAQSFPHVWREWVKA